MSATILLVLATWLVVGCAATYVWIACGMRADRRRADAAFDRELHDLLSTGP